MFFFLSFFVSCSVWAPGKVSNLYVLLVLGLRAHAHILEGFPDLFERQLGYRFGFKMTALLHFRNDILEFHASLDDAIWPASQCPDLASQ